jgi:hypothetical protein
MQITGKVKMGTTAMWVLIIIILKYIKCFQIWVNCHTGPILQNWWPYQVLSPSDWNLLQIQHSSLSSISSSRSSVLVTDFFTFFARAFDEPLKKKRKTFVPPFGAAITEQTFRDQGKRTWKTEDKTTKTTVVGSSAVEGRGKAISASNGKMPVFLNPDIIFWTDMEFLYAVLIIPGNSWYYLHTAVIFYSH